MGGHRLRGNPSSRDAQEARASKCGVTSYKSRRKRRLEAPPSDLNERQHMKERALPPGVFARRTRGYSAGKKGRGGARSRARLGRGSRGRTTRKNDGRRELFFCVASVANPRFSACRRTVEYSPARPPAPRTSNSGTSARPAQRPRKHCDGVPYSSSDDDYANPCATETGKPATILMRMLPHSLVSSAAMVCWQPSRSGKFKGEKNRSHHCASSTPFSVFLGVRCVLYSDKRCVRPFNLEKKKKSTLGNSTPIPLAGAAASQCCIPSAT